MALAPSLTESGAPILTESGVPLLLESSGAGGMPPGSGVVNNLY